MSETTGAERTHSSLLKQAARAPIAVSCTAPKRASLDHCVGSYQERTGHHEAEALRNPEVNDETVDCWLLKRQIIRFLAAQNAIYVGSGLTKHYNNLT